MRNNMWWDNEPKKESMEDTYQTIFRCVERMFNAINTNISNGKFVGTVGLLDKIEEFLNEIKPKLPIDRQSQVNTQVRNSIERIRVCNGYITDEVNNRLSDFIQ